MKTEDNRINVPPEFPILQRKRTYAFLLLLSILGIITIGVTIYVISKKGHSDEILDVKQKAIQVINLGTAPNSGNGDPLRVMGAKVNNNFSYLDVLVATKAPLADPPFTGMAYLNGDSLATRVYARAHGAGGGSADTATIFTAMRSVSYYGVALGDSNKYNGGYLTPRQFDILTAGMGSGTGGGQELYFRIGVTSGAPSAGDSILTNSQLIGKYLFIYRNGSFLHHNTTATNAYTGFRFNSTTGQIVVRPVFATADMFHVIVQDATGWSALSLTGTSNEQNKALYSEQLENAVYDHGTGSVTTNAANDVNGNATLERVTLAAAWGAKDQQISGLVPGTNMTLSFDAKRGSQGSSAEYVIYDVSNGWAGVANADYYGSINASTATRISVNFTVPVGCTTMDFVIYSASTTGDNIYVGRVQVAAQGKDYVTTTSLPVN